MRCTRSSGAGQGTAGSATGKCDQHGELDGTSVAPGFIRHRRARARWPVLPPPRTPEGDRGSASAPTSVTYDATPTRTACAVGCSASGNPRRRPGRLEPWHRRGRRHRQCRRRHARGRPLFSDRVELDRHCATERSRICSSSARKRRPPRGRAGNAHRQRRHRSTAVYTPCPVDHRHRLPGEPLVDRRRAGVYDLYSRLRFEGRAAEVFGLTLPLLRSLASARWRRATGALIPDIVFATPMGLRSRWPITCASPTTATSRTLPIYTKSLPALEGALRAPDGGALTRSAALHLRQSTDPDLRPTDDGQREFRGYFEANGKFQVDPHWSVTGSLRAPPIRPSSAATTSPATTACALRRRRADQHRRYISIAGWAFQGLRVTDDVQGQVPLALPAIDARFRLDDPLLGGQVESRPTASPSCGSMGRIPSAPSPARDGTCAASPGMGQERPYRLRPRRRLPHRRKAQTAVDFYRGEEGWHRGIGALAADVAGR